MHIKRTIKYDFSHIANSTLEQEAHAATIMRTSVQAVEA